MFVAAQQAFLAGQQAKAAAANDATVGSESTVTNVNIVLDPDLSALYNTPGVDPAFKANVAALQCVRYLQSVQTALGQILAAVAPAPPVNPSPRLPPPAPSPAPAPTPIQPTIQTGSGPTP